MLLGLSWNFTWKVLLYDPREGLRESGQAIEAGEADEAEYKKAWGREIKDRNLLSPSRQTSNEENTGTKVQRGTENTQNAGRDEQVTVEPMPEVILSGIIKNPDGSYTAYIKVGENPVSSVRVGDLMHAVSVKVIKERHLELDWKGNAISLSLKGSPLMEMRRK